KMEETKSQADCIMFLNVPKAYIPQEDLTVRFERKKDVVAGTRDWVGLFRVGWTSIRDYYTFEWAPTTSDNPADNKVVFSGRRLPPDDGCFYQFCYVSREGVMRGASVPFQFTKAGCDLNLDDVETVDVVEEGLESIVELRHKDALHEDATKVTATATSVAVNVQAPEIPSSAIPAVDDPRLTEYERVKEELSECKKRIEALEADKAAVDQSNVDLVARLNDSQNQAKTSRDMHTKLSERLDREMATCHELKATNEKLTIRCQETETVTEKLNAQCQQLAAEKADLIKQLNSAVQQRDSLEATLYAKLQAAKDSRDQMEKVVDELARKVKELEEYLAVRENELSTMQQQFYIEKQQLEELLEQQSTARQLEDKNQAQLLKQQTACAAQMQELQQKVQSAEELNAQLQAQLSESECRFEVLAKERSDTAAMNSQPLCVEPPSGYVDKAAHEALQVAYENMEKYYRKVNTELEGCHVQLREWEAKASKLSDQCDELKKRIELGKLAYETVAKENATLKRMLNNLGDQNKVMDFKQRACEDDKIRSVNTKASKHMEQYQQQIGELEERLKRQEMQYQQQIGELEERLKRQEMQYQQQIGELEEMLKRQACEVRRADDENKQRMSELEQKLVGEKHCVEKLVQEKIDQEHQYNVALQEIEEQLSNKHAELESTSTKLNDRISVLELKLADREDNCAAILHDLNKRDTTIKQLEQDKQSLGAEVTVLQKRCRALSARELPARRDSGPPYVPPPPSVPPRHVSQAPYSTRVCPVCDTKFPHRMLQSQFEQHVQAHFSV
ncbi:hypothetical protein EMCRGX_G005200, partial [Ephydatia muelleri]